MEELYSYLITEAYNIIYDNADAALNFINTNLKNAKKVDSDTLEEFVDKVYDIWYKKLNSEEKLTPFRFSNIDLDIKLSPAYAAYIDEITSIPGVTLKEYKTGDEYIQVGSKLNIKFGEGTAFRAGGAKGISYEGTIINEICTFCKTVASSGENKLKESDLNKMFDKSFENIFNMYLNGTFDNLIEYASENPDVDLHEFVISTGTEKVFRNSHDEIVDIDFNITSGSGIKKTLTDSGKIISDVTIRNPFKPTEETYISVKMNLAQLSGINYNPAFYTERTQIILKNTPADCILHKISWDDIPNRDKTFERFNKFFNTFGIDPKEIYDQYVTGDFKNVKISGKYNKKEISALIQMLLGGNYWYVNPKYSIWIPDTEEFLNVNLTDVDVVNKKGLPGKTININGTINGQKMQIILRTSGRKGKFPYRLFAKLNVKKLMQDFEHKA